MKRLLLIVFLLLLLPLLALPLLNISPLALPDAVRLGNGLSAKLACSGYYLSGFSDEQNLEDIATYSLATRLVSLRHAEPDTIEADTFGLQKASARYYPGLGCTLQYPGMVDIDALDAPALNHTAGPWPQGNETGEPVTAVQQILDSILAADIEAGLDSRALLVVHKGEIVAEAYAPGIGKDTPLLGWSMGKSVSAIVLGRMEALGMLATDETDLFPSWSGDARRDISAENLLQMSSGLDFDEPYVPGSDSTRMLFSSPSAADVALASELLHRPGEYFYYSSGTSNMLMRLALDRLGSEPQALVNFFASEIAAPLGLTNTTVELDASGVFVGSSFVYAPARDWARLALPMLNDGKAAGRQLLPKDWVARASAPNASENEPRYGYQFWLNGGGEALRWPSLGKDAYAMLGNREQVVMLLPSLQAVIVRLGWSSGEYPTDSNIALIQEALNKG